MANENIRFPREHMALRDNYFYYFDERNDTLNQKVSNGKISFIFPLDTPLGSKQVEAMEYDGYYFWTLQEGTTNEDVLIKKWYIENFVCKLGHTIELSHDVDHKFNCPSFSLEYYNTALTAELPNHSSEITISSYGDKIDPGTILTLGPNPQNQYENVTVTGTLSGINRFGLDFYTQNSYEEDTAVYFPKNIWLVNHFTYTATGGSLYKISLPNERIDDVIEDTDFESIIASCFYNTGSAQYVLLPFGTTLRFFNTTSLSVDKSMIMDNIQTNQSTVIPIYDLKVEDGTLYRLQQAATYFNTNYTFSTYNYQPSPLRPFIDSISVDVTPKILPSNGVNLADVIAIVKDQYNNPIVSKHVFFDDSDPTGFIVLQNTYTGLYGTALTRYKAGIIPNTVIIGAAATQYD